MDRNIRYDSIMILKMQIMETIKRSGFIQDLYLKESKLECLRAVYTSIFIAEPLTVAKIVRKLDAC